MKDYYISTEKSSLPAESIFLLLKDCVWSKNIPLEYVKRFIKYSLCFGIYQVSNSQLVGFGRVISDYTTYAYVCDIVISEEHRGKGLGKNLVETIIRYPELQGLKTWTLKATDEARKIYEMHGFKPVENPEIQLEMNDLEIYSRHDFVNLHGV